MSTRNPVTITKPTIILVSGKMRSGKDTFADILVSELQMYDVPVARTMFAKAVKDNCKDDFNYYADIHNSFLSEVGTKLTNLKNKVDKITNSEHYSFVEIEKMLENALILDDNFYEDKTQFTRALLQIYGTEIFRNRVDTNHWVKLAFEFCKEQFEEHQNQVVVITDTRFPNEIDVIKKYADEHNYNVISIRVVRDIERVDPANEHESEKALDSYSNFDHVIFNNSTLDSLESATFDLVTNKLFPKEEERNEGIFKKFWNKVFDRS